MNAIAKRLTRATDEELFSLSEALDMELDHRNERQVRRGYQRTGYMRDIVRGKIHAARFNRDGTLRAA